MSLRQDLKIICDMVEPNARVLDIGCGEGELLQALKAERKISGRGIELDQDKVSLCMGKGLSVIQGDADLDLEHYPSDSFDYTILSNTLQVTKHPEKVLREMLRISQRAIVVVPNFGYWKNRIQLLTGGKMPVTKKLSYEWYETPNIHFCTIRDFVTLCKKLDIKIEKRLAINSANKIISFSGQGKVIGSVANIFGEQGIFLLSR